MKGTGPVGAWRQNLGGPIEAVGCGSLTSRCGGEGRGGWKVRLEHLTRPVVRSLNLVLFVLGAIERLPTGSYLPRGWDPD